MAIINTTIDGHIDLLMAGIEHNYADALYGRMKEKIDEAHKEALANAKELAKQAAVNAVKRVETIQNVHQQFGGYQVCVAFNGEQFNG